MAKGKISEISSLRTTDEKVAKGNEAKALILDSRNQMKSALKEMADKLVTLTGVTPAEIAESKSLADKISIGEMDLALSFTMKPNQWLILVKIKTGFCVEILLLKLSKLWRNWLTVENLIRKLGKLKLGLHFSLWKMVNPKKPDLS